MLILKQEVLSHPSPPSKLHLCDDGYINIHYNIDFELSQYIILCVGILSSIYFLMACNTYIIYYTHNYCLGIHIGTYRAVLTGSLLSCWMHSRTMKHPYRNRATKTLADFMLLSLFTIIRILYNIYIYT